ncbi:MAG TPA: beta-ketoacyl-ACP synthase III [Chthoniobacterales bacterium]|jgi:3-oxoacyl-[acyl-carrier-protein] synthase-3|nr:beta-ketoacyl-ACP synthase III [Chthoniobacterales bacterium]
MRSPQPRRSDKSRRTVSIIATGSYVPERILTNQDLERIVDTTDEWIRTRTGISERRIAAADEATSDMATKAAIAAMEQADIEAKEIDLIIVATVTPDMFFPATACWVQKKIGAVRAACFDISAACSGFLYAMEIAQQFISTHVYNTVLIVGADKLSSIVNWSDRNTCVLFGDGAGAAILRNRGASHGVVATHMGSDGEFAEILFMPGGGSRYPITIENIGQQLNTIKMQGKETYKQAVTAMSDAADRALESAGLKYDEIACVIPHQANMRIIEAIAHRMRLPIEKFYVNLEKYGNTSAAAVAIALDEAHRAGRFKVGDYILLVVFGGGLTWASSVIQW